MISTNPEILSPGGDFNSAIHGLKNGADAVYIGLKEFSARKGAVNFTIDEVRRLKLFCSNNNKKIYVAINTLLDDIEIKKLLPIIKDLNNIEVDAVIVQDLGLAKIIKEHTSLQIHASTQLATHNTHGVIFLQNSGFSRVVLSRELSLSEIKKIKKEVPDMEYEIFVHGALCFGFSGLCLASGKILGRSANRGACGQICRTWFNKGNKKVFSLSLNDLALYENVTELKKIGIDSLKIEGRMKGAGYASLNSNLYSKILNEEPIQDAKKLSRLEFSRSSHPGYFKGMKGGAETNIFYPGHTGKVVGRITSIGSGSFTAKLDSSINNRDGLMILDGKLPPNPIKLSANILSNKNNIAVLKGKLPKNCSNILYQISRHDRLLKEEKPESYKIFKSPVNISISIKRDSLIIKALGQNFCYQVKPEPAKSDLILEDVYNKIFYAGGESPYCYPVTIDNKSGIENPFIPQSLLKQIRNSFQKEIFHTYKKNKTIINVNTTVVEKPYIRNSMSLPFITDFKEVDKQKLSKVDNNYLLPLAPVVFDSDSYLKELKSYLADNDDAMIIGLNNISHLEFIKELPQDTKYYCDYGLYNTNSHTMKFYKETVPNLQWLTKWTEKDNSSPPLFISRTCIKSKENGCPESCPKKFDFSLYQNNREYKVRIKECLTYIFTESDSFS